MSFKTISVIGLGYIGLPTAAMFASKEKKVIGVDVNKQTVQTINAGKIHIVEPELDIMVKKAVDGGFLKATSKAEPADVFLIAVPTPFLPIQTDLEIPEPDLSYVKAATMAIAKVLKKGNLVILESTSPVGATEQVATWLAESRPDLTFPQTHGENSDINVAHCPERVLPGHVVKELVENDRVIGGMTARCSSQAVKLYKTFVHGDCVVTNARTAEMAKLTENACRDVQIAFANELSVICEKLNINVWELIQLANRHPRINILQPGPGVGGHCIAVDPWFIISKTPEEAKIIHIARKINDAKPEWVIEKVKSTILEILKLNPKKSIRDITIACFGLAFKANIDDLRESPALEITQKLIKQQLGKVVAIEPNLDDKSFENIELVSLDYALDAADIHLILVDHDEFKNIEINNGIVIDTKGIISSSSKIS